MLAQSQTQNFKTIKFEMSSKLEFIEEENQFEMKYFMHTSNESFPIEFDQDISPSISDMRQVLNEEKDKILQQQSQLK